MNQENRLQHSHARALAPGTTGLVLSRSLSTLFHPFSSTRPIPFSTLRQACQRLPGLLHPGDPDSTHLHLFPPAAFSSAMHA